MRSPRGRKPLRLAFAAILLVAAGARAGDPVPDVDVIMEQIPGGMLAECTPPNCGNRLSVELTKDFAKALTPEQLPEGWTFEVNGKQVVLEGPALDRPTRFKLHAGDAKRPERISYEMSLDGRTLVERKNVKVTPVAPRPKLGSLQGVVTMPTQVAPGEPMRMQVSEAANLPAGGTWSLSGTVVEEEEREDPGNTRPAEPRRRVALAVPAGQDVPDEALDDVAAMLAAQGAPAGTWEVVPIAEADASLDDASVEVWAVARLALLSRARETVAQSRLEGTGVTAVRRQVDQDNEEVAEKVPRPETAAKPPAGTSNVMKMKHEAAMAVIRNIRAEIAGEPGGGSGSGVYSVQPMDVGGAPAGPVIVVVGIAIGEEDIPVDNSPPPITIDREEVNVAAEARPSHTIERVESAGAPAGGGRVVAFDIAGPPATGDQPTAIVNKTRSNIKTVPQVVKGLAGSGGTVLFAHQPDDLRPGSPISMNYVDAFGDVLVDVPSVPGVEVVAPRGDGEARITDATPRSFAGQLVCVCGSFPGEAAWNGLLLDGQGAGSPGSASGQMVWVQLPAGFAPGEHVFTGTAAAGFPAADRASTLVLQVGGEIDSSKLQRLETTPMRLWVEGTEEPVDLRVRNLTPAIISIDGGDDQTIRTSGGARNMLERSVRGLSPGAFDINYELAAEPCPCGGDQTHYY